MRKAIAVALLSFVLMLAGFSVSRADVNVPLGELKLVPLGGLTATAIEGQKDVEIEAPREGVCASVRFEKDTEERRLLVFAGRPASSAEGAKALETDYRLRMTSGDAPRLALVVFDKDGGSWYKVAGGPLQVDEPALGRLSVASLRQTAFSDDASGELEWANIEKVWLGVVIDGPAEGVLDLLWPRFTDEPFKPTKPLIVTDAKRPGKWSIGKDPAVTAEVTTPNEGPNGEACMKMEFRLPGGRHMYCLPGVDVPSGDLEGYIWLRFTYKATLPEGIPGLLVWVQERGGGQYYADPPPLPSDEWTTAMVPLDSLKLAGWSKDPNGEFNPEDISRVVIGLHGTASGDGGIGTIWATDIQFAP